MVSSSVIDLTLSGGPEPPSPDDSEVQFVEPPSDDDSEVQFVEPPSDDDSVQIVLRTLPLHIELSLRQIVSPAAMIALTATVENLMNSGELMGLDPERVFHCRISGQDHSHLFTNSGIVPNVTVFELWHDVNPNCSLYSGRYFTFRPNDIRSLILFRNDQGFNPFARNYVHNVERYGGNIAYGSNNKDQIHAEVVAAGKRVFVVYTCTAHASAQTLPPGVRNYPGVAFVFS